MTENHEEQNDLLRMPPEIYMKERVQDQYAWYNNKSGWNQRWFKRLQMLQIISAAIIPFLSGMDMTGHPWIPMLIGALGVVIAIISGANALWKFQENWTQYRTTAEQIQHERFLFETGVAPYDDDRSAFPFFVKRIEGLISKENSAWAEMTQGQSLPTVTRSGLDKPDSPDKSRD